MTINSKPKIYEMECPPFSLIEVYRELKKKGILPEKRIQSPTKKLLKSRDIPNAYETGYEWELFQRGYTVMMLEINYSQKPHRFRLTVHNSNSPLEKEIEEVLNKFPGEAE
jgi:hypothetical protein